MVAQDRVSVGRLPHSCRLACSGGSIRLMECETEGTAPLLLFAHLNSGFG